jgi:hypothetical protein
VDPITPDPHLIERAAELLRAGRLVAFPTETVYGLGANALSAEAVQRIYSAKGRPAYNPLIVHVARPEQVMTVAAAFDDLDWCEMEITKEVQLYRAYPDPTQYSAHAGGLPSAAHIYAMTLERPAVSIDLQPDALGHLWVAPAKPSYMVKLRNLSGKPRPVKLELTTISHDGTSRTSQEMSVTVPIGGTVAKFTPKVERYGYHDVVLTMQDGDANWTERRSLAWLQKDTRTRGDWEPGRGPSFGFWDWAGAHNTPPHVVQLELMSRLGAEKLSSRARSRGRWPRLWPGSK